MQKWCVSVRVLCTCLPTFPLLSCLLLFLAIKNVILLSYTISSCHICMPHLTYCSFVPNVTSKPVFRHLCLSLVYFTHSSLKPWAREVCYRGLASVWHHRLFFSFSLQLQTMLTFEAIYQTSHSFHWNHKKVITYNLSTYRASSEYRPTLFCAKLVSIY